MRYSNKDEYDKSMFTINIYNKFQAIWTKWSVCVCVQLIHAYSRKVRRVKKNLRRNVLERVTNCKRNRAILFLFRVLCATVQIVTTPTATAEWNTKKTRVCLRLKYSTVCTVYVCLCVIISICLKLRVPKNKSRSPEVRKHMNRMTMFYTKDKSKQHIALFLLLFVFWIALGVCVLGLFSFIFSVASDFWQ